VYGKVITNMSQSNLRPVCPIVGEEFQRCPSGTDEEISSLLPIHNLFGKYFKQVTGNKLYVISLAGNPSNVGDLLNKLDTNIVRVCHATTHAQNLHAKISFFTTSFQRKNVTRVVRAISTFLEPLCDPSTTIIQGALNDGYLCYVSNVAGDSNDATNDLSVLEWIIKWYEEGHKGRPLLQLQQYTNVPPWMQRLIQSKVQEIIRIAQDQSRTHPYRQLPNHHITPNELLVIHFSRWHSQLGVAASAAKRKANAMSKIDGKENTHINQVSTKRTKLTQTTRSGKTRYGKCDAEGCTGRPLSNGVCIDHGGAKKLCSFEGGCNKFAKSGGVCYTHGAPRKLCSFEGGCNKFAQSGGVCKTHGAPRKLCNFEGGCNKFAQSGGVCNTHGAPRSRFRHNESGTRLFV
jgi:hypothetical protein